MAATATKHLRAKRAAIAAAAIAAVALALPFYATETESGTDKCHLGAPEVSETSVGGWSWWPIGTRCVLVTRDGRRHEAIVPPWRGSAQWQDIG